MKKKAQGEDVEMEEAPSSEPATENKTEKPEKSAKDKEREETLQDRDFLADLVDSLPGVDKDTVNIDVRIFFLF